MTKSRIPSFFLPNLFISFLFVSLTVLVLFILSHLDMTSSPPRLRNASSKDTLDFRRAIVVILQTLIVIFSPLTSPSLRTIHSSHPISEVLPLPYISPPSNALSRPLQVYHRRHHVVAPPLSLAEVPNDSPSIPSISPTPPYHLLTICLLLFEKVIDLLVILILFIIF